MFHEFDNGDIVSNLEQNDFNELEPPITPEQLEMLCEGDSVLERCLDSMFLYVNRYAYDVYSMMLEQMELSEKREHNEDTQEDFATLKETDERRHNLHNALMDSINLLSRELGKREKNNEWMHDFVNDGRAGYARFALLTFYKLHANLKNERTS